MAPLLDCKRVGFFTTSSCLQPVFSVRFLPFERTSLINSIVAGGLLYKLLAFCFQSLSRKLQFPGLFSSFFSFFYFVSIVCAQKSAESTSGMKN